VNDWLQARNGWTLLLSFWAITLVGGLLGTATTRMLLDQHPTESLASHLPWVVGGSLLVALAGTGGTLLRRRRQAS
jgi:hypothetical protein